MTFTVRSLLELPSARVISLTPGVGEQRAIGWAHACELSDPWRWLGHDMLVMTTGIAIPESTEAQCAYLSGMHAAGIAGVLVDEALAEGRFSDPALTYASHIGFPVLQTAHEVPFATIAMAVAAAAQAEQAAHLVRADQLHGSLLFSELCGGSVPAEPATRLVATYGIDPQYQLAAVENGDTRRALDEVHAAFARHDVPALATIRDGQVLILTGAGPAPDRVLESLSGARARIGVGAVFGRIEEIPSALRQARSALIRTHESGHLLRFEESTTSSLFLPNDAEQLRGIAKQVLGPLRTYDQQRSTSLTQTLRVFLEENRSWVRAAERLFVHRQTLIARISRIEKIIDRDLASIEDTAECWLAVQAAIACGDLEPTPHPSEDVEDERGARAGS